MNAILTRNSNRQFSIVNEIDFRIILILAVYRLNWRTQCRAIRKLILSLTRLRPWFIKRKTKKDIDYGEYPPMIFENASLIETLNLDKTKVEMILNYTGQSKMLYILHFVTTNARREFYLSFYSLLNKTAFRRFWITLWMIHSTVSLLVFMNVAV